MSKTVTPEQLEIEVLKDLTALFKGITIESSNSMIDLAPVSTGALKASINASIGGGSTGFNPDDQDPTGDSTKARNENDINKAKIGDVVGIVVTAPYGRAVEEGSSDEAPSGFIKITGESLDALLRRAIQDIAKRR